MRSILDVCAHSVVGAQQVALTAEGLTVNRLPPTAATQSGDMMLMWTGRVPSGVSIAIDTDADVVEIDVLANVTTVMGRQPAPPPVIDVTCGGTAGGDAVTSHEIRDFPLTRVDMATMAFEQTPGGPETLRIELPPATGSRRVEIWLPNTCPATVADVRIPATATAHPADDNGHRRRWVHYGSSISQCGEASSPTRTWPAIIARRHDLALTSFGLSGQCQLDQFMAQAIAEQPADIITLKLGINIINLDSMRERTFVPAVHAFLDTVRRGHPTTPIVVTSPIFCPSTETAPGPTLADADGRFYAVPRPPELSVGALTLVRIRELLASIVAARIAAGDAHLRYVDGLAIFGAADAHLLPDDLHPNTEGYALMAERFSTLVFNALAPA